MPCINRRQQKTQVNSVGAPRWVSIKTETNCNDLQAKFKCSRLFLAGNMQQLRLFSPQRLPRKPYCSNNLEFGLRVRPLEQAAKHSYIQLNPPGLKFWLVFDIDRPQAAVSWSDADLPEPAWTAVNPKNDHAHIAYALAAPVSTSTNSRAAPEAFYNAIESSYCERLGADDAFAGLVTKNPTHADWNVHAGQQKLWDMRELADWTDLKGHPKKREQATYGEGYRNKSVFDAVRAWAYKAVREYRDARHNFDAWQDSVHRRVVILNENSVRPMSTSECWHIAKSISKFCWKNDPAKQQEFSAKQAAVGKLGGTAKGMANEAKRATARLLAANGASKTAIARNMNVHRNTVSNWLK